MHQRETESASVRDGLWPPPLAATRTRTCVLKWERRLFPLPPFSLSAPVLVVVWEGEEGEEL